MRIASIDVFSLRYPMRRTFKFFPTENGKSFRPAVLVKLITIDGVAGWGMAVPVPTWSYETVESVLTTLRGYLIPAVLGMEVWEVKALHDRMNSVIKPGPTTGMPFAKAAIDIAAHDAWAKSLGVNIARLWGRTPLERVQLSWTVEAKSLDAAEESLEDGLRQGYSEFNFKVAPDPDYDVDLARMIRRRVPQGMLWADANGGSDFATARSALRRLADEGVSVIEQPLPPNQWNNTRELKRIGACPILLDEPVISSTDLMELIRFDCCDGITFKHNRMGGLWQSRIALEMLEAAGLMYLGSGLCDPDVSFMTSIQFYASFGFCRPNGLNGMVFMDPAKALLDKPIEVVDGGVASMTEPGIGFRVDEGKLESFGG